MGFEKKLSYIKSDISKFSNNKNDLMVKYIQRKLDRSLNNYLKEVEIQINYLLYRDSKKVQKYLTKKLEKGDLING